MNARELHDKLSRSGANPDLAEFCAGHATILRALDLLARTEESTDELVRRLRVNAASEDCLADMDADLLRQAAAALVVLKARAEKAEAERDGLKQAFDLALTWVPNDHATRLREQAYRAVYKE